MATTQLTTQVITWTASATATSYIVQYRVTGSPTWITFATVTAPTTTSTITGLAYCTSYDFQVTAVCPSGNSSPAIFTGTTLTNYGGIVNEKFSVTAATANPQGTNPIPGMVATNVRSTTFGSLGTARTEFGYTQGGDGGTWSNAVGSFWLNPTSSTLYGRLNNCAVWAGDGTTAYTTSLAGQMLGFNYTHYSSTPTTLYVGIGGGYNNYILVDGQVILLGATGIYSWRMFPVNLQAGTRIITVGALCSGSGSPFAFGAEIYNNTSAEILAATSLVQLNIVYSTSNEFGQPFHVGTTLGWSCSPGYYLDTSDGLTLAGDFSSLRCVKRL